MCSVALLLRVKQVHFITLDRLGILNICLVNANYFLTHLIILRMN